MAILGQDRFVHRTLKPFQSVFYHFILELAMKRLKKMMISSNLCPRTEQKITVIDH